MQVVIALREEQDEGSEIIGVFYRPSMAKIACQEASPYKYSRTLKWSECSDNEYYAPIDGTSGFRIISEPVRHVLDI